MIISYKVFLAWYTPNNRIRLAESGIARNIFGTPILILVQAGKISADFAVISDSRGSLQKFVSNMFACDLILIEHVWKLTYYHVSSYFVESRLEFAVTTLYIIITL